MDRDLSEIFQTLEPETRMPADCALTRLLGGRLAAGIKSFKLLVSRGGMEKTIEESATLITTDSRS
jgi:hypothetical protein